MADDVDVVVWLEPPAGRDFGATRAFDLGSTPVPLRAYVTRAELRAGGDSSPDLHAGVAAIFRESASVERVGHAWRRVLVRGSRAACVEAVRTLSMSPYKSGIVVIFGLDVVPGARVRSFACKSGAKASQGVEPRAVARAYRLPVGLDGAGTSIAVPYFSGTFVAADLRLALQRADSELPRVVLRGDALPASGEGDVEIALGTQIVGAIAPGATLVLYAGRDDACGYADTIAAALLDEENAPSIITLSYGIAENEWPADALRLIEQLFIAAALCGITVLAAGARACASDSGEAHVAFPASDPFVLACGGTDLRLEDGRRVSERVWNEPGAPSGGGYSRAFDRPVWQARSNPVARRGVPDVSGHAASSTGYVIYCDGAPVVVGGTSAVAPLWAAFVALVNQRLGRTCGFFAPLLYRNRTPELFYDITLGNDGTYTARSGWDPCTGLGSPNFAEVLRHLAGTR